jgi:hypothetical protein
VCSCAACGRPTEMSPTEFERHSGMITSKKWRRWGGGEGGRRACRGGAAGQAAGARRVQPASAYGWAKGTRPSIAPARNPPVTPPTCSPRSIKVDFVDDPNLTIGRWLEANGYEVGGRSSSAQQHDPSAATYPRTPHKQQAPRTTSTHTSHHSTQHTSPDTSDDTHARIQNTSLPV